MGATARSPTNTASRWKTDVSKSAEIGMWSIGGCAHPDARSRPIIGATAYRTRGLCP